MTENLIKNTLAILIGLSIAMTIILLGATANKQWFDELNNIEIQTKSDIFLYWKDVVAQAPPNFFIALLTAYGIGSIVGGVVTAMFVPQAKQAYAMLIGFILFGIAVLDYFFINQHPTWYFISLLFVFFPFSWLGGKAVDEIQKRNKIL